MFQRALIAVGAAAAMTLAGCTTGNADSEEDAAAEKAPPVLADVCRAHAQPAHAPEHFDSAHRELHQLAADVADTDRTAAGQLLEAKRAVEAAREEPSGSPAALEQPLERLVEAVRAALRATGQPAPPCHAIPSMR